MVVSAVEDVVLPVGSQRLGEISYPSALRHPGIGLLDQLELIDLFQASGQLLGQDRIGIGNDGKGHRIIFNALQEGHGIAKVAVILGPLLPGQTGKLFKQVAILAIGNAIVFNLQQSSFTERFQCDPVPSRSTN